MGLASSQARYLFITSRIIDVQGALMSNTQKQMRLTDRASDIAEAKNNALRTQQWSFNLNNSPADIDYNTLMDNGYFIVSGDNNRVVLNSSYANAMRATAIKEEGGNYSDSELYKFMAALGKTPKSEATNDWAEVRSGVRVTTKDVSVSDVEQTCVAKYGRKPSQEDVWVEDTIPGSQTYSWKSLTTLLSGTINFNNINGANQWGVRTDIPGRIGYQDKDLNWQDIMNSNCNNLVAFYCEKRPVEHIQISNIDSTVDAIGNAFKNVCSNSSFSSAVSSSVTALKNEYKAAVKNALDDTTVGAGGSQNSGAFNATGNQADGHETVFRTDNYYCSGMPINILSHYENGNVLTGYDIILDVRKIAEQLATKIQGSLGSADQYKTEGSMVALMNIQTTQETKSGHWGEDVNEQGYNYESWMNKYNQELQAAGASQTETLTIDPEDKETLAKYERIFSRACQGWKEDGDLSKDSLTNKLVNNQYLLEKNGERKSISNSDAFALTSLSESEKDQIEAEFDVEEKKIKREEKKLSIEETSLQTELTALQTEEQSVKSIIEKNIERGFNLFG